MLTYENRENASANYLKVKERKKEKHELTFESVYEI